MMTYEKIIAALKTLDPAENEIFDYRIEMFQIRRVAWWNKPSNVTQHYYFDENDVLYNVVVNGG